MDFEKKKKSYKNTVCGTV